MQREELNEEQGFDPLADTENPRVAAETQNPLRAILRHFTIFRFKKIELRIFNLLSHADHPLLIREIADNLEVSTRTIRKHIISLYERGFVTRELVRRKWLGYAYKPISSSEVWSKLKEETEEAIKRVDELFSDA